MLWLTIGDVVECREEDAHIADLGNFCCTAAPVCDGTYIYGVDTRMNIHCYSIAEKKWKTYVKPSHPIVYQPDEDDPPHGPGTKIKLINANCDWIVATNMQNIVPFEFIDIIVFCGYNGSNFWFINFMFIMLFHDIMKCFALYFFSFLLNVCKVIIHNLTYFYFLNVLTRGVFL